MFVALLSPGLYYPALQTLRGVCHAVQGCMAQTVGSDIARMAREAGAKLLPGIFSEDNGEKAPKTGGAKASQVCILRSRVNESFQG